MTESTLIAVVTGAGSGIGRAVAQALSAAGHQVVHAGRDADRLEETAQGLGAVVPTDIRDAGAVSQLFATTSKTFGRVDVLFNNAGVFGSVAPVEELPVEAWTQVVETNLTGAFLCAQAAFRAMKDQRPQGGRIINNGSLSAHVPRPHAVAYTVSKHGLLGLTRALALEGRQHDIAVGQIDIGNAATSMTDALGQDALQADGRRIAEPRFDAEEVARLVVMLAAQPLDVNVLSLEVMATGMPFVGRG